MKNMLIIQSIGAIAYILLSRSYFQKTKKKIIYMQIFAYIFFIIHFYLLSGVSGALCNIIGLCALISIYISDKKRSKNKRKLTWLFIIILWIVNLLEYQNIFSIFPMVAITIVIISFLENKPSYIRVMGAIASICWLIYGIAYKSYISIFFNLITLIEITMAIIQYSKKKRKTKKENKRKK